MAFRKSLASFVLACSALLTWWPISASAVPMTLQTANNVTGNQPWSGVGVKFDVNSPISVSELGVFDSNQDGIAAPPDKPLSAYLLTSTGGVVASMTFDNTSQGTLDVASKYRFKAITPVNLAPGTYVLAGYGWNSSTDLEHNCNLGGACDTFNTGGGLLTYFSSPYGGGSDPPGTLPTNECCGNANFFSAANMRFVAVPEPSAVVLLATGLVGLLGYGGRRSS